MQSSSPLPAVDSIAAVDSFLSWSAAPRGERFAFSRAWPVLLGLDDGASVVWPDCVLPEDRAPLAAAFARAVAARQPHEAEYRVQHRDAEPRWLLEQAVPVYDEAGVFVGYRGISFDITRRKLAEHSLRQSEQRFRRSFDNPLGGMIIATAEKVFVEVNDKLCDMLGYSREELVGRTWAEFTHPDDVPPNVDLLADVVAGRSEGYLLEKRYRRKDGQTLHAVISARAVRDEGGRLQYLVTMVQDVTSSRKMERLMQVILESTSALTGESFFRSLVESLADALNVRYALVGQFGEEQPDSVETIAVWQAGGFASNFTCPFAELPSESTGGRGGFAQAADKRRLFSMLNIDVVSDAQAACVPLFDHQGKPLGLIAIADEHDFADAEQVGRFLRVFAVRAGAELERMRADRQLKRSRALLRSVFEHLPQILFLKDARNLRYALVNEAAERLLGLERECIVGKQDHDLFDDALAERFIGEDLQVLSNGRTLEVAEQVTPTTQGQRVLHVQKIPLYDEDGVPEYVLGIAEDVTERKQVERQLISAKAEAERANNAKSRFLAAASHDLRQPLSALSLYVGVLGKRASPADRPLLSNMKDCVGSLSELLTDLLDLSKLDAGVVTPNIADFAIAEVLANLVSVHAPDALLKGLRLRCVPSELIAHTDPVLFRRMLGNLISNAIRYTERGSVLIGCRRRRGKVWVEVWDTGIGVPADKTGEIFEEFRQLGNDERNGSKGSGLGLAIVARTAALLGLQIRVESRPGRGSMFAVEMPLGRAAGEPDAAAAQPGFMRIALVEDNPVVRNALAYALRQSGHHVVAAAGGRELVEQLGQVAPDVVISDYRLADGETGFDAIAVVRGRFDSALPALIITGDTDPKITRSMADGGVAVQHKPLDIDALLACVAALTRRPGPVGERMRPAAEGAAPLAAAKG